MTPNGATGAPPRPLPRLNGWPPRVHRVFQGTALMVDVSGLLRGVEHGPVRSVA